MTKLTRGRKRRRPPVKPRQTAARTTDGAVKDGGLVRELDVHREELAAQNDELRRANAALAAAKERYAELYDGAPVAYFTLDAVDTIIEVNLAGAELLDVSRNGLFGRKFDELVVPSSRSSFRDFCRRLRTQGGRPLHDTVIATSTRRVPVRILAARLGGSTSSGECLLCVMDETERRPAAAQAIEPEPANDGR